MTTKLFCLSDYLEDDGYAHFLVMWHRFRRLLMHVGVDLSWATGSKRQEACKEIFTYDGVDYGLWMHNPQSVCDIDYMGVDFNGLQFLVTCDEQLSDRDLRKLCRVQENLPILPFATQEDFVSEFFEFLDDYLPPCQP